MPHAATFAPPELTISYPDSREDFDRHETLESKKRSSEYYSYVSVNDSEAHERDLEHERRLLHKLGFSFFLFGLINNGELLTNTKLYKLSDMYLQFSMS